jgi:hypothetical protein
LAARGGGHGGTIPAAVRVSRAAKVTLQHHPSGSGFVLTDYQPATVERATLNLATGQVGPPSAGERTPHDGGDYIRGWNWHGYNSPHQRDPHSKASSHHMHRVAQHIIIDAGTNPPGKPPDAPKGSQADHNDGRTVRGEDPALHSKDPRVTGDVRNPGLGGRRLDQVVPPPEKEDKDFTAGQGLSQDRFRDYAEYLVSLAEWLRRAGPVAKKPKPPKWLNRTKTTTADVIDANVIANYLDDFPADSDADVAEEVARNMYGDVVQSHPGAGRGDWVPKDKK